jgi:pteridine reductase
MKLTDKVALVTGGATRVGREIVQALAAAGMRIVVHYHRSEAAAQTLCAELTQNAATTRFVAYGADLNDASAIERLADQAWNCWQRLDLLVNNAAVYYKTPWATLQLADWDQMMSTNLRAPFWLSWQVGQRMRSQGGAIINIADWSTARPYADFVPYGVSKAGLVALTQSLAKALAPEIRVNAISPGAVLLNEDISSEQLELIQAHTLLKQLGKPQDIAAAVCFLAAADFITGINLVVDGGRLLYSN